MVLNLTAETIKKSFNILKHDRMKTHGKFIQDAYGTCRYQSQEIKLINIKTHMKIYENTNEIEDITSKKIYHQHTIASLIISRILTHELHVLS